MSLLPRQSLDSRKSILTDTSVRAGLYPFRSTNKEPFGRRGGAKVLSAH